MDDLDEALRELERLVARREWAEVLALRDRCRAAIERGHQLWPAAEYAEYRLALEAPAELAASVVLPGAGRFAPGPLAEVVASRHRWRDLARHLPAGPGAGHVAHERVMRGEDLTADPSAVAVAEPDIPLALLAFEPSYTLPTFRADGLDLPSPPAPAAAWEEVAAVPGAPALAPAPALRAVVAHWSEESEGRVRVAAVEGGVAEALGAIGVRTARVRRLTPAEALDRAAWAAASGGAHARRRGAARGREAAWFGLAGTLALEWPLAPDAFGVALARAELHEWDAGDDAPFALRIVVTTGHSSHVVDAADH